MPQEGGQEGVTCLLLRKQLWMTFMMKFAASRSVMLGLNLCLVDRLCQGCGRQGRCPQLPSPQACSFPHSDLSMRRVLFVRARPGLMWGCIPSWPREPRSLPQHLPG